jgi:cysteine-rich repeat protein
LASDEVGDAQLSAFVHVGIAKARAARVNPAVAPWLARQLDTYVNEPAICNAYSTGDDIHFFRRGSNCENTSRLADVVYHEFAHSLHKQSLISGVGAWEPALSEGLADFFAASIVEDSGVGRGFMFTDQPLREINPVGFESAYPQNVSTDPHMTGLIIAGALWDLRTRLIADYGLQVGVQVTERIFAGILARAPDIAGSYMAALIADDDDANLANGTPHQCSIDVGFRPHGLVGEMQTTSIGPAQLTGLAITVPVGFALPCYGVTGMTVTWQSSAGSGSFPLVAQGSSWTGELPAQPDGLLLYRVDATLADGKTLSLPNNPADPMYQLFIGPTKPVWCETFDSEPAWTAAASVGARPWQWGPPRGGDDPDAAHTGTSVYGSVLDGDGHYEANEVSSVVTPVIDLSGVKTARLQYWRWLTVQDGVSDQASITVRPFNADLWHNVSNGVTPHIDREWRFHDIDLTSHAGVPDVQLRWILNADPGTELGGWTIDDVCVVTTDPAVCGDLEVGEGEECDDGNHEDGDGCSKLCTREDGGCCSASTRPESSLLLVALLAGWWRRRPQRARRREIDDSRLNAR